MEDIQFILQVHLNMFLIFSLLIVGGVPLILDGSPATHDALRGEGDFQRTILAIKNLVNEKIPTFVSFTAHKTNYRYFGHVADISRHLRVTRVWGDRMIPFEKETSIEPLDKIETKAFFRIMRKARWKNNLRWPRR